MWLVWATGPLAMGTPVESNLTLMVFEYQEINVALDYVRGIQLSMWGPYTNMTVSHGS